MPTLLVKARGTMVAIAFVSTLDKHRCMLLEAIFSGCCLFALAVPTTNQDNEQLYRGQIEWARLMNADPEWARHAHSDPVLLNFIRETTTLNIDPVWHVAGVKSLKEMTAYPFLFSSGIGFVTDEQERQNIHEYLLRGGFIFIDACINTDVNPDPDVFLATQIATFKAILPNVKVVRLPDDHPIYHSCFQMRDGLPHTYMQNIYRANWAKHGLYAVYTDNKFVALISLSGLQCTWAGNGPSPEHRTECMRMMVNIYVYVVEH